MTIIQHTQREKSLLLAIALFCSITIVGCRDFQDCRTPYKDFVTVAFLPINKEKDTLAISSLTNTETKIRYSVDNKKTYIHLSRLPLDPQANTIQFIIDSSPLTYHDTLFTIHYQREAVLISHQCGYTYKYVLKKVTSTFAGKYKIINKELSTFNDSDIDLQIYF